MLRMAMAFLLVLLAGAATPIAAQVRYKDSEGVTHWVNSLDEVPPQYRAGAAGKPVVQPPPTESSRIDWEQKAREADERAERATRERAADDAQQQQQRAAAQAAAQAEKERQAQQAQIGRECYLQAGGQLIAGLAYGFSSPRARDDSWLGRLCDELRGRCRIGDEEACQILRDH